MKQIDYWIELYREMRKAGEFGRADKLREMLRGMGYEVSIKQQKDGERIMEIKHYE